MSSICKKVKQATCGDVYNNYLMNNTICDTFSAIGGSTDSFFFIVKVI